MIIRLNLLSRLSPAAEDAVLEMLWRWGSPRCRLEMTLPERDWWIWGSENHHIMAWTSFWGAVQIFSQHPDYSQPPQVNGEPVDYRAQKVYDCPYIQSDFGDGVVVIKKDRERLVLDFNSAQ